MHIQNYRRRPCTCVLITLRNICDCSVISKFWNSKKMAIQTIIYYYSTKDGVISFSVIKAQNNSRFSNSITHTHIKNIIIIQEVHCNYRKEKQRVSCHLNTNSCSLNYVKYKNTHFGDVFCNSLFKRKLIVIKDIEY